MLPRRGAPTAAAVCLRIDFGEHGAPGPGTVRLMELIGELGSILRRRPGRASWFYATLCVRLTCHGGPGSAARCRNTQRRVKTPGVPALQHG